jgi:hypothetical protein
MRRLEFVSYLNAPPQAVWTILTDFASYPMWDPLVQLSGIAALGAVLRCAVRIGHNLQRVPGDARVTELEAPKAFAWAVGVHPFIHVEERYVLDAERDGTKVIHRLEFSGWFGSVWQFFMRRYIATTLVAVDRSLASRVDQMTNGRGTAQRKSHGEPSPRRHQKRRHH